MISLDIGNCVFYDIKQLIVVKDSEKEEYTYTLIREDGSPAERPFEERYVEGSF